MKRKDFENAFDDFSCFSLAASARKSRRLDATAKLPADKVVTRQDADGVMGAELRNSAEFGVHPGGVAAAMAAAARLNEGQVQEQGGGDDK